MGVKKKKENLAVLFALNDRQTEHVWVQTRSEDGIAVVQHVMRGDGASHVGPTRADKVHCCFGSGMFQHDLEARHRVDNPRQQRVEKHLT